MNKRVRCIPIKWSFLFIVLTLRSPLYVQVLVWRTRGNVANGWVLVTNVAHLSDTLVSQLPRLESGSSVRQVDSNSHLLSLDHAAETFSQCARCCMFAFPVLALLLLCIPPLVFLFTNTEAFIAMLPCWMCVYVVWLLRMTFVDANTVVLQRSSGGGSGGGGSLRSKKKRTRRKEENGTGIVLSPISTEAASQAAERSFANGKCTRTSTRLTILMSCFVACTHTHAPTCTKNEYE